jgi:REase_AHJR-like
MAHLVTRTEHDHWVRTIAIELLANGYEVRARVEGWFDAPEILNGYRPDIIAMKGNHTLILEVKKGEVDWPKISALERWEQEHNGYELCVVDTANPADFRSHLDGR